jgi:hypothetical protein
MSSPTIDDLQGSGVYTPPRESEPNGHEPGLKFIDADIGEFIKRPKTAIAREYEHKAESALNAVMRFCAQNPKTVPDAAAIIAYGDNFAAAVGEVAEINPKTRRMIDLILTPESPWLALAIAGIPLATQLMRNHQESLATIPSRFGSREQRKAAKAERKASKASQPKFTFKILGKQIGIRIPLKFKLGILTSQTVEPESLTNAVFSNEQVVKALKKRGIDVAWQMPAR